MNDDDAPVGRILSRREVLALFGAAGAALVVGACSSDDPPRATATPGASPTSSGVGHPDGRPTSAGTASATSAPATAAAQTVSCVVTPELTEGPFFVDETLDRSDIRSDSVSGRASAGVPLVLNIAVFRADDSRCTPLAGALVDVWQCDAEGVYSDVLRNTGDFLRGQQVTDGNGAAQFTTIYPGWYGARAVHIHFKVRAEIDGRSYDFTSQWFFQEALNDEVLALPPYSTRGRRTTMNADDRIFRQNGDSLTLLPTKTAGGYWAPFDIALRI